MEKLREEKIKTKRWKPKDGETYWYLYSDGTFERGFWILQNAILLGRYKIGNCFKSKKDAQKELDRRLAEQELLDMCDNSGVIEIGFDIDNREFCAMGEDSDYLFSPYRFATEESAQKAIDTLGEEKLKLIFRID